MRSDHYKRNKTGHIMRTNEMFDGIDMIYCINVIYCKQSLPSKRPNPILLSSFLRHTVESTRFTGLSSAALHLFDWLFFLQHLPLNCCLKIHVLAHR